MEIVALCPPAARHDGPSGVVLAVWTRISSVAEGRHSVTALGSIQNHCCYHSRAGRDHDEPIVAQVEPPRSAMVLACGPARGHAWSGRW